MELLHVLTAPSVTTTSVILSSNNIQNAEILVPANPGLPGKWPLKWKERDHSPAIFLHLYPSNL